MKLDSKQKEAIRARWPDFSLRFEPDGSVLACRIKPTRGEWGLMYSPAEARAFLEKQNEVKHAEELLAR